MSGKLIAGGIVIFTFIFGVALYYTQFYGYYQRVNDLASISVDGRDVVVSDYEGLDASSSPLKLYGCFTVDPAAFEGVAPPAKPTPVTPPEWFDCYDSAQITADLDSGAATAHMAYEDEKDGFDRVVAVYPDGRAYQWRQLNEKYQE